MRSSTSDVPISSRLSLRYESENLDILQIGILNKSLHNLLNQVAISLLEERNEKLFESGRNGLNVSIPTTFTREDILIRAKLTGVREGSIILDLQPYVAAVASDPNVIAVLQNLVANVIWAIGSYGARVKGVRVSHAGVSNAGGIMRGVSAKRRLSTKVEHLVKDIKEAGNGGKLTIKSDDEELTIELYAPASRKSSDSLDDL